MGRRGIAGNAGTGYYRKIEGSPQIDKVTAIDTIMSTYNLSLIKKATPRKKRFCLKCGIRFLSAGSHNRCCATCAAQNKRAGRRASQGY